MTALVSEQQLSRFALALLEAAPDPIIVCDSRGRILLVNRQTERVFGHARERLLGVAMECLLPRRLRKSHSAHVQRFATAPATRPMGSERDLTACRADGSEFSVEVSLSPIEIDGHRLTIAIARDVTERRSLERQLRFSSTHDALTGLFNRAHFESDCRRLHGGRSYPVGVIVADLDGLKRENDEFGHARGDQLLRDMAEVLEQTFRSEDSVARIGGDEFAVLVPNCSAHTLGEVLGRMEAERLRVNGERQENLRFSVGAATADGVEISIAEAVRRADVAMYAQKRAHRAARASDVGR